jgi:heat shock protein HtpX
MAATTFYSQIGANKRNSILLVLAVVLLLGVLGLAIGWAVTGDPRAAIPSLGIVITIGLVASLFSYFAGASVVLSISGAKEVTAESAPQLLNVVQEMALAANVPMPRVYLIDDTAPNAFATGRDPQHASVAITVGLLEKLDREELQGVIAHELSHVRNFDIRFSLLVGVLVGSIALLADFFLRFSFWGGGSRRSREGGGGGGWIQIVVFVVAILLAILAPIMARLVQMAISRQREYLADASGVELTRNPVGLERALAKISLDREPLEVANRATQHLYFENPIKAATGRSSNLFSTHPPALERINRLRELNAQPAVTDPVEVLDAVAMRASLGAAAGFAPETGEPPLPPGPPGWNRPS